jgi:HSP20 family protein
MAEMRGVPVKQESTAPAEPRRAWDSLGRLRRDMDRLFDEFSGGIMAFPTRFGLADVEPFWRAGRNVEPVVDFVETPENYRLTAELPGMDEKNIEVKISNGNLLIAGEKREEKEEKKPNFYLSERRYGSFHRSVPLPEGAQTENIAATFRNGVLTVTLPKSEAAKQEKKIEIKPA